MISLENSAARVMAITLAAAVLASCTTQSEAKPQAARSHTMVESAAGSVDLGTRAAPYRVVTVSNAGAIVGRVILDSTDGTSVPVELRVSGRDSVFCSGGDRRSKKGTAIVWVADVRQGEALPGERRTELVNERCQLTPRLQAVVVGTTINVKSDDPIVHHTRFVWLGKKDSLPAILTNDAGEVVPVEQVGKMPGIVEVRCDDHPWTRGYVAVFDHPYFAIADEDGRFRIDGLPAGEYHVRVWREGARAPVEQRVEVRPAGESRLDVTLAR
jgi:hypothetical protein